MVGFRRSTESIHNEYDSSIDLSTKDNTRHTRLTVTVNEAVVVSSNRRYALSLSFRVEIAPRNGCTTATSRKQGARRTLCVSIIDARVVYTRKKNIGLMHIITIL